MHITASRTAVPPGQDVANESIDHTTPVLLTMEKTFAVRSSHHRPHEPERPETEFWVPGGCSIH